MDIYVCDAGDRQCIGDSDTPEYHYGQYVINLVVAKTPGRARALFTKRFDFDFIEKGISVLKVMSNVDIQTEFVAGEYDYGYREREQPLEQYNDECWAIHCRKMPILHEEADYYTKCPYYEICKSSCKYIKGLQS